MTVVTRFAPSPTGFLHIGGARTALFNWLLAKHTGGKFLLRIEDTDRERSTQAAVDAILDGMRWMGLEWDGDAVFQFSRVERHAEVAKQLLDAGHAYRCYCSQEELKALREQNLPYDRRWRDSTATPPAGVQPVIRLKSPLDKDTIVRDHIRGEVRIPAGQLEDLVIMRSDGTPTYNLAVVVDDHDMGITHVVRGEDHLTNAAKQQVIYEAMGWKIPEFAHVPMIHGPDGAKLSKRHGALGVDAYRDMGYLPEAMRNYLLRLGWAHGDDEIISTKQAIEWFTLDGVGKSPSRFDFVKLENLNGHYIREADDAHLLELTLPLIEKTLGRAVDEVSKARILRGMKGLKARAKTLLELAESAIFYAQPRPLPIDEKAQALLTDEAKSLLGTLMPELETLADFRSVPVESLCRTHAEKSGKKLGAVAQPLRAALTGKAVSPPVFEVMEVLGREEALARIRDVC